MLAKRVRGDNPNETPTASKHCNARKGHEIVAPVFSNETALAHVNRRQSSLTADDFVLCQGESGSGASLGACDGSGTLSCVRPVVRLMSDRESVSAVATPLFGFRTPGMRP